MTRNNEPGGGWDYQREIERMSPTADIPRPPEPLTAEETERFRAEAMGSPEWMRPFDRRLLATLDAERAAREPETPNERWRKRRLVEALINARFVPTFGDGARDLSGWTADDILAALASGSATGEPKEKE